MARIDRFEDIEGWQKARELTKEVYAVSSQGTFAKDFALRNQIGDACVSAMSNIAEGFGRGGNKEFVQFLSTAKGSATEVQSQLYAALDAKHLTKQEFERLYNLAGSAVRLIGGFMTYLRQTELRGSKFTKPSRISTLNAEP